MQRGSHPMLPRVARDPWEVLKRVAERRRFRSREMLFRRGMRADELYLLEEGRVRLFRRSPEGKQLTFSIVEPGDLFGEMVLLPEGRRESDAQALTPGVLYAVPRHALEQMLSQDPTLPLAIMENLGRRAQALERRLGDLVFKSVPQRLAALLLDLAGPAASRAQGPARLPHRYTHQQLAEMINSHRETVTKVLQDFRNDRLALASRQGIVLLDMERLREMALR
ncbi:MAG: Crp/Fnr family transcriptional regulator [Chloroflexia bacterium]